MHHAVSLWESPLRNRMTSHLLELWLSDLIKRSLADRAYHWWNQRIVFSQQTQRQHNMCGRYHPEFCIRSGIDENWWPFYSQSRCNTFINVKYLQNIINAPGGKYLCVLCNVGVTYTNKIGNLPGYPNPVYYNLKGVSNILSLLLVQKHHLVTYNIKYGNWFVVHIQQHPKCTMTNSGLFYHITGCILKNKSAHIMVNDSLSPIPQAE